MSELIFYTGVMGSAKSAHALMLNYQLKEKTRNVWLIKPAIDTREPILYPESKTPIRSRIGIEALADVIYTNDLISTPKSTDVIICDEAQFLTSNQAEQLKLISDTQHISVYCYGLKTDFKSNLFEGSKRLLELASKIIDVPVICECGNVAVISARITDGKVISEGSQIDIGGNEKYKSMCYKCWKQNINK